MRVFLGIVRYFPKPVRYWLYDFLTYDQIIRLQSLMLKELCDQRRVKR